MNYTEKYHLPQWDETDRIMRADFNRMCADMEAGLLKTAQDAAAGIAGTAADAGTAAAEAAAAAAAAQATADQAVSAAAAAQATANAAYCPTNLPYVVGTYTGNNAEQTISVGFRPRFLIIGNPTFDRPHAYAAGNNIDSSRLRFTNSGFTVLKNLVDYTSTIIDPAINSNGLKYVYIAFR